MPVGHFDRPSGRLDLVRFFVTAAIGRGREVQAGWRAAGARRNRCVRVYAGFHPPDQAIELLRAACISTMPSSIDSTHALIAFVSSKTALDLVRNAELIALSRHTDKSYVHHRLEAGGYVLEICPRQAPAGRALRSLISVAGNASPGLPRSQRSLVDHRRPSVARRRARARCFSVRGERAPVQCFRGWSAISSIPRVSLLPVFFRPPGKTPGFSVIE